MPGFLAGLDRRKALKVAGAGLGLMAWVAFFIVPQGKKFLDGRSQTALWKRNLETSQDLLRQIPRLEQEMAALKAASQWPDLSVAPEEPLPALLEMIAQAARTSKVQLLFVKPKEPLANLKPLPAGHFQLALELEAFGGYHEAGSFLDALENSERLLRVRAFKLQNNPKDPWRHQVNFTLETYWWGS